MKRNIALLSILLTFAHLCASHRMAQVKIPVACMRELPSHAAEQCSQAVLGTPVYITERSGDWYKIKTPDNYTGYMRSNSLVTMSDEEYARWQRSARVVCKSWLARLYDNEGNPCGYATYGAVLKGTLSADSTMVRLDMPDGSKANASADLFYTNIREWRADCHDMNMENVISVACSMLGSPYLWGGNSTAGIDCSGFTQTAYKGAGILLPRDTSMQIKCGVKVESLKDARRGDLIFYGDSRGRVNHVAIYLGEGRIIHSSGDVRICRMSGDVPGNEPLYTDKPISIRRVFGTEAGVHTGVESLFTMYER